MTTELSELCNILKCVPGCNVVLKLVMLFTHFHVVSDMKLQQSTRIKANERKYERIICDKASKHQLEINVSNSSSYARKTAIVFMY